MDKELNQFMDDPIIHLDCFEPAGGRVEISPRELLGHTLVVGATGCGKTTSVISPLVKQLAAIIETRPVSLLIIDLKNDPDLPEEILSSQGFDQERLKVISADSSYWIDPFSQMRRRGLAGLDATIQRIGAGVPVVEDNAYWHSTFFALIRQVLSILYLGDPEFSYDEAVGLLSKQLLGGNADHLIKEHLLALEMQMEPVNVSDREIIISELKAVQDMWFRLDQRTRSNLLSMGPSIVDPLRSEAVQKIFKGAPEFCLSIPHCIERGDVILLQMNGFTDVEAAAFVGKVLKSDFYEAILSRKAFPSIETPLAGFIADEWSSMATGGISSRSSDATALQLIRSKGGFVVAGTQSISAIDLRLGIIQRRAALANFNNLFVMRSREEELEALSRRWFGFKDNRDPPTQGQSMSMQGGTGLLPFPIFRFPEPKVPVIGFGDLTRLETGQAFASVGSRVYQEPVWLVPSYYQR
jgi:hypothetical protein